MRGGITITTDRRSSSLTPWGLLVTATLLTACGTPEAITDHDAPDAADLDATAVGSDARIEDASEVFERIQDVIEAPDSGAQDSDAADGAALDAETDTEPAPEVVEPECEQGTFCQEGEAGVCSTSGLWLAQEDCGASGLLCVGGSCRSACEIEGGDASVVGCDHWAVALEHGAEGPFAIAIFNPSDTLPATVAVWRRLSGESEPHVTASATVNPREAYTFPLGPADTDQPGRSWHGWRVRSTAPVIASQHSPLAAMSARSGDGSLLLPAHGMGTEYIATGRPEGRTVASTRTRGTLTIVAAEAGTLVTVDPATTIDAGDALGLLVPGEQALISLQPYEVLHLTTSGEGGDLSGTRLYASRPIAVFAGHEADRGATPVSIEASGDHLEDALRPVSRWGRVHVAPKTKGQGGLADGLIIVAAYDDTLVQFSPAIHGDFQIESGERRSIPLSQDVVVSASRPIQLMQLTAGAEALVDPPLGTPCVLDVQCALGYECQDYACQLPSCEGALDTSCPSGHRCQCEKTVCQCDPIGDAAWWIVPPVAQFEDTVDFIAPPTFPSHNAAILLSPLTQTVHLDGAPVALPTSTLGGSGYRVATLSVTSGPHTVQGDGALGVIVYGVGRDVGYGHAGGQALRDLRGALCEGDSECAAPPSSCSGFAFCDTEQVPPRCDLVAESSVNCAASPNPCVFSVCVSEGGTSCAQITAPDGTVCASSAFPCAVGRCDAGVCSDPESSCGDGLFCNGVEFCDAETNTCQLGTAPLIDDGVACSVDACDESLGKVTHLPAPGACDDGFVCNGLEVCDLIKGCIHQSLSICDDGVFCNGFEECDDVSCFAGTAPTIDDGLPCTLDACNEAVGAVVHVPDDALCGDEAPCTLDLCDPEVGCVNPAQPCDDVDACTTGSCVDDVGCVYADVSCDDQDACTVDSCDGVSGCLYEVVICDDGDPCTEDFCLASFGCVFGAPCNDGDACTVDGCTTPGDCSYEVLGCDDADDCTTDSCDSTMGCVNSNLCDDDNACTSDQCSATSCSYAPIECDDQEACTADSCSPLTGCSHVAHDCSDGDLCTEDQCDLTGTCLNPSLDCDDGNACTSDLCDALGDCLHVTTDCDDGIACTADVCHSESGCENSSPCDDGLLCTVDICLAGGGCEWNMLDCDDVDPCTTDSCDNVSGCLHTPSCGGE
jgi:hypothetical protein